MGAHKQIGQYVWGDGSRSHGWEHQGAFKEAGADAHSRTQS